MEYADRHFVGVQLQARQRMGKNHHICLLGSVAQNAPELKDIMQTKTIIGGQLAYYYNSMFGPLGASFGYSNRTKSLYLYINLGFDF